MKKSCLLYSQIEKKRLWSSNADTAFISIGFSMLKDAAKKLLIHEATICHKGHHFAINYTSVASSLSLQHKVECKER